MSVVFWKLAVRVVVFALSFAVAAARIRGVRVTPKLALPVVGLVFALLNTGLYWLLKPILNLATLGGLSLLAPFLLNVGFLWATDRLLRPLRISGMKPLIWLALLLTIVHGVLYLALDLVH
jgi:uncharacterized membrane protein YvlD (DUF360 family)